MIRSTIVGVFCFLLAFTVNAQHDFDSLYDNNPAFRQFVDFAKDTFDLFNDPSTLELTVRTDIKALVKEKLKDNEYKDVFVDYLPVDTIRVRFKVQARARGNFRRNYCKFPPVRLDFSKTDLKIEQFRELDKMKMVVRCKGHDEFEQYLMNEYLIYKAYNILTNYSYRVRLLKVNYVDTGEKFDPATSYAFLIEPTPDLAKRLEGINIKTKRLHPLTMDPETIHLLSLFQYMIGNTDWSIPGLQNIRLVKSSDPLKPKPFPVPYDFDYSGMVNASYAIPAEVLGISNVRERLFWGPCSERENYEKAASVFNDKKEELYTLFREFPQLSDKNRKNTLEYLDSFFSVINDPRKMGMEVVSKCRE